LISTHLKLSICFFLSLIFLSTSFPIYASSKKPSNVETKPAQEIPAGLDFKTRHATRRLIEFEPFVGEYLGNILNNSFVVGGRLAFRVTEAISIGADFNYSQAQFDPNSNFGQSVHTRNEFITDALFMYSFPVLQRTGKAVQEADLFATLGAGDLHINGKDRFVGVVGGGLKIFFKQPWLALRFDVTTYLYSLPRLTDSKFADDWSFTVGPSFLFVPKKSSSQ
jgi:outer membrane beta-barrel protein